MKHYKVILGYMQVETPNTKDNINSEPTMYPISTFNISSDSEEILEYLINTQGLTTYTLEEVKVDWFNKKYKLN